MAASGSAIGLGNVVFFPANAYRFGGGSFYLPYLLALLVVGVPLLIVELGLGREHRRAYPGALRKAAGGTGEFLGWWALFNTGFIALCYVAILGWVVGMLVGSLGPLWEPSTALTGFDAERLANPRGFFYRMISRPAPLLFIALIWAANLWIVRRGAAGIERAVRVFVPAMWILMFLLLIRGVTLPGGVDGVWYLFTPDPAVLSDVEVWRGAISQIFFTISIGFGVMTAYGAYLPERGSQTTQAVLVSFLNCGFEYVAGIAVFAILFAFAVVPQASTIAMTFFIAPEGIGQLPGGPPVVTSFGVLFFLLLLLAGLSSSVSMVEALVAALREKFDLHRGATTTAICTAGILGSWVFALPHVVDPQLHGHGTLGMTLFDLIDHWAFDYGLLLVGLSQALLLARHRRIERLRRSLDARSPRKLGPAFDILVGRVIPVLLTALLVWSLVAEVRAGLYGADATFADGWSRLATVAPGAALLLWLTVPTGLAILLTRWPPVPRTRRSQP